MGERARTPTGTAPRRRYHSSLRAQRARQTRDAVLDAASRLFTSRGWAATGIRDIAREAGVAPETVYAHYTSKTELLRQIVDIAVVGDDDAVPLARRPSFAALGAGARDERIAAAARLITDIHRRTAGLAKVIREAAHSDEAMAGELDATRRRQCGDVEHALTLLLDRKPTPTERDGVVAVVSVEVYLLLTEFSGWSTTRYQRWIAQTLGQILPDARPNDRERRNP